MALVEIAANPLGVLIDSHNRIRPGEVATITNLDGSPAVTWSAPVGGTSSTAPVQADAYGVLPRWIEEGSYPMTVGGVTHRMEAVAGASPAGGGAGGVLSGSYPNPGFAVDMATQAELDASAALKASVVALTAAEARITALEVVASARVYNSADLAIPHLTPTYVTFDSERYDNGGLHSTAANTSRLTAPVAGLYLIGASIEWATSAVGRRQVRINLNRSAGIAANLVMGGSFITMTPVAPCHLAAGDYAEVVVDQDSGAPLNLLVDTAVGIEFWMTRIGP